MAEGVRPVICRRESLLDGGGAVTFDIEWDGRRVPGFVVAFDGGVHAWVNVCPHRGTTLDWLPGRVFDASGLYLVCATHGALFEADTGRCVSGPCQGASLRRIGVEVVDGDVVLGAGRLFLVA